MVTAISTDEAWSELYKGYEFFRGEKLFERWHIVPIQIRTGSIDIKIKFALKVIADDRLSEYPPIGLRITKGVSTASEETLDVIANAFQQLEIPVQIIEYLVGYDEEGSPIYATKEKNDFKGQEVTFVSENALNEQESNVISGGELEDWEQKPSDKIFTDVQLPVDEIFAFLILGRRPQSKYIVEIRGVEKNIKGAYYGVEVDEKGSVSLYIRCQINDENAMLNRKVMIQFFTQHMIQVKDLFLVVIKGQVKIPTKYQFKNLEPLRYSKDGIYSEEPAKKPRKKRVSK